MSSKITSVDLIESFEYETLNDKTDYVLVPTKIVVSCTGVKNRGVQIHPLALPFGLLDRVEIRADVPFTATIEVIKTTSRSKSEKLDASNALFHVTQQDTSNNQDAADVDLDRVKQLTGHVMKHRMIAAASVAGVLIDFVSGDVPENFNIFYYGANVLPKHATRVGKYAFQLPPLTPTARMNRIGNVPEQKPKHE